MQSFRTGQIVLYTMGVGRELNESNLERMASETGGRSIIEQGEGASETAVAKLIESLHAPILYVVSLRLSDNSLPLLAKSAPPLRGDQTTLFLTRGKLEAGLSVLVDGKVGGKELKVDWPVPASSYSEDFAYLPDLWSQWERDSSVAAPGDARRNLAMAQADHNRTVSNLVLLGEIAARRGQLDQAKKFLDQALEHDPGNLDAKTLLRGVESQQKVLALAQVRPGQDEAPVPAPPAPVPGRRSQTDQPERARTPEPQADILSYTDQIKAATEQLRTQTNAELDEARKLMSREPEKAIDLLKGLTLLRIDSALDIPESDRATMRRQVETALRQAAQTKVGVDIERAARLRAEAEAAERQKMNNVFIMDQQRLSQLVDQYWALMKERSYREALDVSRQARELKYGEALPELMMFVAETTANWYE